MKSRTIIITACIMLSLIACKNGKRELQVLLTDAPAEYEEVNIEIVDVKVNYNKDTASWVSLSTNAGIYNLLDFQDSITTPIANGTVPEGTVKELRLILGSNNTVKVNQQTYPLTLTSQGQSGLKIKLNKKLEKDLNVITIDFDAAQSVVKEQNGEYKLHPVIMLK